MKIAIAYYRVSTDQQSRSGLGLEAQQEAVRLFADREGYQVQPILRKPRAERKTTGRRYWPPSPNAGKRKRRS